MHAAAQPSAMCCLRLGCSSSAFRLDDQNLNNNHHSEDQFQARKELHRFRAFIATKKFKTTTNTRNFR